MSPDWRQMAIKALFLTIFDPCSSIVKSVFDCRLPGVLIDQLVLDVWNEIYIYVVLI